MGRNRSADESRGPLKCRFGERLSARIAARWMALAALTCCHTGSKAALTKEAANVETIEQAAGFGYECAWLAVRSTAPSDVIARLGIGKVRRTPWREGIDAAYSRHEHGAVYVTPPIDGWVLVAGTSLFAAVADQARRQHATVGDGRVAQALFAAEISSSLATVVQYFLTYDFSGSQTWILADRGKLVRAYGVEESKVLFDKGERTPAENELGIRFDLEAAAPPFAKANPRAFAEWMSHEIDAEMVMRVAARWSVDPRKLQERRLPQGWVGTYRP